MIDTVLITFENTEILNVPVAKKRCKNNCADNKYNDHLCDERTFLIIRKRIIRFNTDITEERFVCNCIYNDTQECKDCTCRECYMISECCCDYTGKYRSCCTKCWKLRKKSCKRCHVFHRIHHRISKKSIQASATEHRSDCQTSHSDSIARNAKW